MIRSYFPPGWDYFFYRYVQLVTSEW